MTIISIPGVAGLIAANSRSSSLLASFMIVRMECGVSALAAELLGTVRASRDIFWRTMSK